MVQVNNGTQYRFKTTNRGTFLTFKDADGMFKFIPRPAFVIVSGKHTNASECVKAFDIDEPFGFDKECVNFFHGVDNATRAELLKFVLKYPDVEQFFKETQSLRLEYLECRLN